MPDKEPNRDHLLKAVTTPPEGKKLKEVELNILPEGAVELFCKGESQLHSSKVLASIASGGFADIYLARMVGEVGNGRTVVVKVFRDAHLGWEESPEEKAHYINRLRREYAIWAILRHENINPLDGLVIDDVLPSPGLVSSFIEHGDLNAFNGKQGDYDRLSMARGIASGLKYLHSMDVIHGDLTMRNILVDKETKDDGTVVFFPLITDFGKSRIMKKEGYTTAPGTHLIMDPPELLDYDGAGDPITNKIFTCASDVYSFALVLLELVTGVAPYSREQMSRFKLANAITGSAPGSELRPTPKKYPTLDASYDFCWPIMRDCWRSNKDDRITSRDAHKRLCEGSKQSELPKAASALN